MAMAAEMAGQVTRRKHRRDGRRHPKRSALALGAAGVLILGAGCAQESDGDLVVGEDQVAGGSAGFAATPEYINHVVDNAESESYRFSMDFSFDMFGSDSSFELAQGAFDGDTTEMTMDFGAMFDAMGSSMGEELPTGLDGADLSMHQVVTPETMYIRAPFFAAMSDSVDGFGDTTDEPGAAIADVFSELGDGWGSVDVDALGDVLPGDAQQAMTGQSADPSIYLEMLRQTESVEELGTDEIDGVEVNGLSAEVGLDDLMAAAGTDPGTFDSTVPGDLSSLTFPLEVWVDGDDQVRRIGFSFDAESLAEVAGEDASDIPAEMGDFSVGMTMDFTDYGEDIDIDVPTDATDITDAFVALYAEATGG